MIYLLINCNQNVVLQIRKEQKLQDETNQNNFKFF
jgi:hypothetical protein